MAAVGASKSWSVPKTTVAFGTPITAFVKPKGKGYRTKVTQAKYTAAGTAHTLTFLTPLAQTTAYAAAASGALAVILSRDPGLYAANAVLDNRPVPSVADNAIAANDWLVIRLADGQFWLTKPSAVAAGAVTGTITATVSAVPASGILAGATVWFLGITTDTNPRTGLAHPAFACGASATSTFGDNTGEIASTPGENEPLMVNSDNATATGTLEYASGVYGP